MPVFSLPDEPIFPPTHLAEPSGLLAVGGDLSAERLVLAYASGIFPWYSEGDPILWHAPAERMVLPTDALRLNRSTRKAVARGRYTITLDTAFARVIAECARAPREGQDGTWITAEMVAAYTELHSLGFAHSAEAWLGDELVGGLYGVSLGAAFFGESMFARAPNASKVAFAELVWWLAARGVQLVDAQVHTPLLASFGAQEIARHEYEVILRAALRLPTMRHAWSIGAKTPGNQP